MSEKLKDVLVQLSKATAERQARNVNSIVEYMKENETVYVELIFPEYVDKPKRQYLQRYPFLIISDIKVHDFMNDNNTKTLFQLAEIILIHCYQPDSKGSVKFYKLSPFLYQEERALWIEKIKSFKMEKLDDLV